LADDGEFSFSPPDNVRLTVALSTNPSVRAMTAVVVGLLYGALVTVTCAASLASNAIAAKLILQFRNSTQTMPANMSQIMYGQFSRPSPVYPFQGDVVQVGAFFFQNGPF